MSEKYSDLGTKKQMQMRNRVLLGDERGGVKRAYVVSNLDILFDNELIDNYHREAGKTYWAWRTIARKRQGYAENPAYEESTGGEECQPVDDSETEVGAVWELFTILTGLINPQYLEIIDACCCEADKDMSLLIIQIYSNNLAVFADAFTALDKGMMRAREIFEKRCEDVKNGVDRALENI